MATINIDHAVCLHNVAVNTGYHGSGSTVHVIIFLDKASGETYAWRCTNGGYGWDEGTEYSIKGTDEGSHRLSRVKIISYDRSTPGEAMVESEQKTVMNALDILLPVMNLTNDEKYDIIRTKGVR